jgi:hypothetical protein
MSVLDVIMVGMSLHTSADPLERMRAAMNPPTTDEHKVTHTWRHWGYKARCTCGIEGRGRDLLAALEDVDRQHAE